MKERIIEKIRNDCPAVLPVAAEALAERLMDAEDFLQPNITEWLEGRKLSDIFVRERHCIGSVMKFWGTKDFVSAFIALDDYAKDEAAEIHIWRARR